MRHSILHALAERQIQMDEYVGDAITRYCTPENLGRLIDIEVTRAIDSAVKEQAESYFKYGAGRKFIAEAVAARLSDQS
jgi:hypothetical protein